MIYLGTPGRMVGISCPDEQRLGTADRYSFQTTLEGQVKAQVRPVGRRVWDLRLPRTSTPADIASLEAFANGDWGPGPFWFVSADAPVVNLLTPRVASSEADSVLLNRGIPAGPWATPYGFVPKSLLVPASSLLYWETLLPVVQGQPVTGSVVVQGDQTRVGLNFYNAQGGWVYTSYGSRIQGNDIQRATVTATPPENAVGVRLVVSAEASRVTMPAVTWTDEPVAWAAGQGCEKAVIHAVSSDLVMAIPGRTYADLSFTVTEVG